MDFVTIQNFVIMNKEVIIGVIVFLILALIYKENKIFKNTIMEAILSAEANLNSEPGQAKLDYVVNTVKTKLPKWVSVFITKKMIVDVVEQSLNFASNLYNLGHFVDIKGNEEEANNIENEIKEDKVIEETKPIEEDKNTKKSKTK